MSDRAVRKSIVLIDRQRSWLERSAQTLRRAGFEVESLDTYIYPPAERHEASQQPRLVILGCASIGKEEMALIERILTHGDHLLVLSTSLSSREMRSLFLHGATDVTDKPYDSGGLVTTVNQALESISSYQ